MSIPPLLLILPALGSLAPTQQDRLLADEALAPLAESLAAYLEARASTVGLDEARTEIELLLAELGKLLEGNHPLDCSADLGRALWLARRYDEERVERGKVTREVVAHGSFTGAGMELAYRLPKDYDPAERAYPLILALPDADEGPASHLREHWTLRELLDGAILVCPSMPDDEGEWDRVSVDGRPGGLSHVLAALRHASQRFAVDFDRVYVAGRGKGVPAAVAAGNTVPQRFAGIIGRAGDLGDVGHLGPGNFANLPTLFTGAGAQGTAFQAALAAAGIDNCRLETAGKEEDVWRWLLAHPRRTYPTEVKLVVGQPFPTRVNWLRVAPIAPAAHATGTIDRERNTVRIASEGVSHVTLYLSDALLDLDAPVTVVCNGVERTAVLMRRLPTVLELVDDGTSDPGAVYVVEAFFDARGAEAPTAGTTAEEDAEFEDALAEAEGKVRALRALALRCEAGGRTAQRERVLRRILLLEPDDAEARAALGYHGSEGAWFPSAEALARHERRQIEENAVSKGHVKHKLGWIHSDERSLANKGWEKDWPTGQWLSGGDRRRLADGWVRQDLEWIEPEEAFHVADGLWRVDGEWVTLEVANRRHAKIEAMWRIPGAEVLLHSTADRDVALRAQEHMARAVADLRQVFGVEPVLPLEVAVLRDEEQYDRFAFGDPDGRRPATDPGRLHVVHSAFFAEGYFPRADGERSFAGMGVCYWDPLIPYGDLYGVHSARLAVGLSYADAVDPSPKTVKKALSRGPGADYHEAYQDEKELPAWLRHGGAVYAERYFHDPTVEGDNDPWWARSWSLDNLRQRGGLRPLAEVLAFDIDPADREDAQKLLLEAGLVVSFLVDGGCAPARQAHAELKRALVAGKVRTSDLEALTETLLANEGELRAFAGL